MALSVVGSIVLFGLFDLNSPLNFREQEDGNLRFDISFFKFEKIGLKVMLNHEYKNNSNKDV